MSFRFLTKALDTDIFAIVILSQSVRDLIYYSPLDVDILAKIVLAQMVRASDVLKRIGR